MHPVLRSLAHHDRLPRPPMARALGPLRAAVVDQLLTRERGRLDSLAAVWRRDRRAAGAELEGLVDQLLVELRQEVWRRSRAGSATERLAGAIDARLHHQGSEHMDDPTIDEGVRTRIVADLERVNGLIGSYERLVDVAGTWLDGPGPVTVLDLASGHGGLPLWLATRGPALGLDLRVIASDLQPAYLALARAAAEERGVPLQTRVLDALHMDLEPGEVDVITCTLALHHLRPGQVSVLLAEAVRVAGRGVVFMDGLRALTQLVGGVGIFVAVGAPRPSLHDTVVSVRRMFATEELALMVACAPGCARASTTYVSPAWSAVRAQGAGQRG